MRGSQNNQNSIREFTIASKLSNSLYASFRRARNAKLSDEEIEEVAKKVLNSIETSEVPSDDGTPDDGTILLLDEGASKDAPAEQEPAKEEKPIEHKEPEPIKMSASVREALIAFRMIGLEFNTRKEYEEYKNKTDIKPGTKIHILEDESQVKLEDEDGGGKAPAKKEEPTDKSKGKPEDKHEGDSGDAKLKSQIEKAVGKEDAGKWKTHPLDKSQMTDHTKIQFPDGSTKLYKELNDREKARVTNAINAKKVAHFGMNDYTKVDKDTLASNMKNNLDRYDEGTEETKNTNPKPVTKESVKQFTGSMRKNAESVLDKYKGAISDISRDMLLGSTDKDGNKTPGYLDHMTSAIEEAFNDEPPSMGDVSEADLDEFCREEMKRMVHQEVETRRRSLGDHGIRHLASNADNTMKMLSQLKDGGIGVTGKDKLMGLAIQANHDMGYTLGIEATSFGGNHRVTGGQIATQEVDRYSKIFGKDSAAKMADIITTHDAPEMDWEKEPLQSAVRLADNMSLFGKDKVQDLFIRSPKAMEQVCKLKVAADIEPPKPQAPKEKNYKDKPDEYKRDVEKYNAQMEEYNKPEVQARVKEAKQYQNSIKAELHKTIDAEGFNVNDKELLHKQIDETSSDFTSMDILSRYSGRINGTKFDKNTKVMSVDMAYSPEGHYVDMMFGDKVAGKQFGKFVEGMGGKKGSMDLGKPPSVKLNIEGMQDKPEDTATTDAMRGFLQHTVRHEIMQASNVYNRVLGGEDVSEDEFNSVREAVKKIQSKCTADEWKQIGSTIDKLSNWDSSYSEEIKSAEIDDAVKNLKSWPLLESEKSYLMGKKASIANRIVISMLK